ncbi:FAD/NAD(P)-binding protein [Corynebacterium flavescens]
MSSVIFIGGGPRTTGILLRLAANLPEFSTAQEGRLERIDVVDPFPAGSGRIWRRQQSGLLWMNSMAQDISIFADASVRMSGPVIPGPTLAQWVLGPGREAVEAAGLGPELEGFSGRSFASRRLQSLYLDWAFNLAVERLARAEHPIDVRTHACAAVELSEDQGAQLVRLSTGEVLRAHQVVLAQGHLDVAPSPEFAALGAAAADSGLAYVPPGFTADQDLSVLPAAEPVIVRGFGLAFIDAMVLLTEGRGGRFRAGAKGLQYLPSGREPQLWVGSGRGIPLVPKIDYVLDLPLPQALFLDATSLHRLNPQAEAAGLGYEEHILPLLVWNLRFAHYQQLWAIDKDHQRITGTTWEEFSARLHGLLPVELLPEDSAAESPVAESFAAFVEKAVPDPADRFDFAQLNDPLAGQDFEKQSALEDAVAGIISSRVARSGNVEHSTDLAVFLALLSFYFRVQELAEAGYFSLREQRENIDRRLHRLFSYIDSGPPALRLEQLLALHRAGIVRFLGPRVQVSLDGEGFLASSPALAGHQVRARALIDAFLADDSAAAVDDELLRQLLAEGEVSVENDEAEKDSNAGTLRGKFRVDANARVMRADGSVHRNRFLLGPMVAGGSSEAPFARPGTNARGFSRADALARILLKENAGLTSLGKEYLKRRPEPILRMVL